MIVNNNLRVKKLVEFGGNVRDILSIRTGLVSSFPKR